MKVFISYSWDSEQHRKWVQELADSIGDENQAIEVIYDRIGMDHQVDRNQFMEKGIYESDVVLAIITTMYTEKANQRVGGVGRETAMAAERHWTDLNCSARTRVLAVKREADVQLPSYLRANLYFDFSDDARYSQSLQELQEELRKISISAATLEASQFNLGDAAKSELARNQFSFTRTEELIAGAYKQRTLLWSEEQSRDYSGKRRAKYELWLVETPHPQLLLVLPTSVTIRHTLESLAAKLPTLPSPACDLRLLTVLRPTTPEPGYIASQLLELGLKFTVTELTFKEYLSRLCISIDTLEGSTPFQEPFYIDQALYRSDQISDAGLGPAKKYLLSTLFAPSTAPISLLVASGGAGKTTLLRCLAADIEKIGTTKVIYIEADSLKKLNRDQLRRAHISSLYDLYELDAISTPGTHKLGHQTSERGLFELLLISGSVLIIIDGIDELLSLMQGNFEIVSFIESINELNSQLGKTRVVLASREDAVARTVASMKKHGVSIYSLRGFTESEVREYTNKRFLRRSKEQRLTTSDRVVDNVRTASEALGADSVVLPFFVDVLCQLEEEVQGNDTIRIGAAVADRLADADYAHNNTVADLLVFTILDRERERQGWTPTVAALVEVFKELSSFYSGVCNFDNFKSTVEIFLGTTGKNVTEIFCKNPLLRVGVDYIAYKYDFLNSYFLSLWIIDTVESGTVNDLMIRHLSSFSVGKGRVFDDLSLFFSGKRKWPNIDKFGLIYRELKKRIVNESEFQSIDKKACSAVLQLFANSAPRKIGRLALSNQLFSLVGEERVNGRTRVSSLYIYGTFPALIFSNLDVWNSEFVEYEAFTKCHFEDVKFYFSIFANIHGDNRSPLFSKDIFDVTSCELGNLSALFDKTRFGNTAILSVEEIKRFFKYFFVGGGFVPRRSSELFEFSRPGLKDEVIAMLVTEQILLEKHAHSQLTYVVSPSHNRHIQKFVNENNMNKQLRSVFRPFLEAVE